MIAAAIGPALTKQQNNASPVSLWQAQDGPQQKALDSDADIIGYGGEPGGGKTDLLIGAALTRHTKSLILRRVYPNLRAIIERSKEVIGTNGRLNEMIGIWRGLPGGRTIEFGSCKDEDSITNYQGRDHDLKAFDEVTEFSRSQFEYITTWARSANPNQRSQVIATFNPPTTVEGRWVLEYWAAWLDPKHPNPAADGELRWYTTIDGKEVECKDGTPFQHNGELITPKSRTFIRARLQDNAYLRDTGYLATLQALPEPLRSILLRADFSAAVRDDPWQVIPTAWVQLAQERFKERSAPTGPLSRIGVDVARGGSDKTVIAKRYGNWFAPLQKHTGKETPDGSTVAGLVINEFEKGASISVDVIGVGSSVYDELVKQRMPVTGINNASAVSDTDRSGRLRFANVRAHALWSLREALDPKNGLDLALPDDKELLADLCSATWKLQGDKVRIESKEDIKGRIGRSPDSGDALVLAWYEGSSGSISIIDSATRQPAGASTGLADDLFNWLEKGAS